ncbi:MAG: hypothetical protein H3C35_00500 [Bacteroidetes bacterium]|nr:hypothetical protein [Bacteroidota bacterium]
MRKILLMVSVFPVLLFSQTPYDSLYLKSKFYASQIANYQLSRTKSADVVMLGNSITYGGNWNELLGRERIINRGIVGDNLPGILRRMNYVYALKPKLCFIMAGINDLYADASVDEILIRYAMVVDTLRANAIIPVIQSTLHANPKWKRTEEKNPLVTQLNSKLKLFALQKHLEFINLDSLLSKNEILQDEYTTDGIHLTPQAYAVWRELLDAVLRKYGL